MGSFFASPVDLPYPRIKLGSLALQADSLPIELSGKPAVQETRVQSLAGEDALEKEMATHSSILSRRILQTEEPGRQQSMGSQESDMTL